MATTKNHKITNNLPRAINYALNDKTEEKLRDDIKDSVAYALNDKTGEVTYYTIRCTMNCDPKNPVASFENQVKVFGKLEAEKGSSRTKDGAPVLAWHFHQNFEGFVDPTIANEIGRRLAEEVFKDFPVVIGTHTNTENTHNHIIVSAWNLSGHKWHQHNAIYQHIREVSDRLCEEYGLTVLSQTKQQKLLRWTDEAGQIHYYEPTSRKNELIRQRQMGEVSSDDVGSYRNTIPYEKTQIKDETNRQIIKRDIDRLLPVATSYEHLLEMLRQIGYIINDKKKNGEWLKHVSFQPPTADKPTRDYKIDNSGFYIRENLEQVIAELEADRAAQKAYETEDNITPEIVAEPIQKHKQIMPPYFEEYVYGKTVIADIDEDIRTVKIDGQQFATVERGETERAVVRDVKVMDSELRLIDTSAIDRAIEQRNATMRRPDARRAAVLEEQIRESFHVLRFMENNSLCSRKQINAITASTWAKYNECVKSLDSLDSLVARLEITLKVPEQIAIITERIDRMKNNQDYMEHEYEGDFERLESYRDIAQKFKLNDPESAKRLAEQVAHSKEKIGKLQGVLEAYRVRLTEYDRCINVLNRIDTEQGRADTEEMQEYIQIKKQGEQEARESENKRDRKKMMSR